MNTNPDQRLKWSFRYDHTGRLMSSSGPGGRATQFDYDSFPGEPGRVRSVSRGCNGSLVNSEFDRWGRRIRMSDAAGTVDFTWTKMGQLRSARRHGKPMLAWDYDGWGRMASQSIEGICRTEYRYDFMGRLEAMDTPAGTIRYEYWTGQAKVVRILPNKVRTLWSYDDEGRLLEICHVDPTSHIIARFSYAYRPDGLIAGIAEWWPQGERRQNFEYDAVQRLVALTDEKGQTWRAEYDPMGNRLRGGFQCEETAECRYDWAGRILSIGGTPCKHDAAGNLVEATINDVNRTFEFDHENRLRKAGEIEYDYDGDGYLIARTVRGGKTTYLPDPTTDIWRPLLETCANGRRRIYLWEDRTPVALVEAGTPLFFLGDHLGSVRCVVDAAGGMIERRDYSAFGDCPKDLAGAGLMTGFAGLFWDEGAGISLTRTRAYCAGLARFLQTDPQHRTPSGNQSDLASCVYCGADPLNKVDRNGMAPEPPCRAWEFSKAFITGLPKTVSESLGAGWKFWRNASAGGIEFGPQPGSLADQAGRMGGVGYERTVQALSGIAITTSAVAAVSVAATSISTAATALENHIGSVGLRYGGSFQSLKHIQIALNCPPTRTWAINRLATTEWFHFPLVRNALPFTQHLHWGIGEYGAHLATRAGTHFYGLARGVWHASFGANPISYANYAVRVFGPAVQSVAKIAGIATGVAARAAGIGGLAVAGLAVSASPAYGGQISSVSKPSPVGGVYLGGAGRSLDGLGQISGVAVDEKTGSFVLLTEKGGNIDLPPLRLDDVVVIFRSVYLHGEGPSVSIDPVEGDPHGPVMNVRHGKFTADTYVGWVLFETDRIMKCYGQGEDNVTHSEVLTKVPAYDELLETMYFGGDFADGRKQGGNWERYWIVPAEVMRYRAGSGNLTLFDVPLKVNSQKMVLRRGKLEDAPDGASSQGALAFTDWFTRNYESIAQERYLPAPPESGVTELVPIYAELRRIALTTAIAEQLCNQGMPMPFWMRDYPVKPVPFTKTTPSLTTKRETTDGQMHRIGEIFGGVNLSPADSVVKDFASDADVSHLPTPGDRETATSALAAANTLAPAVAMAAAVHPPLTPFAVSTPEREAMAVSVPGADSTALAPCRLREVDLEVAGEGGVHLSLVRYFNSFFQPKGELGTGWTWDLPRLNMTWIPKTRTDYGSERLEIQELVTPLNSLYARFSRVEQVAALNNSRLHVPDKPCEILALAGADNPLLLTAKTKLIFRDGRCWFFDENGRFVAAESKPVTTVYHWDENGRVIRISEYSGDREAATIRLDYDHQGRVCAATPTDPREAVIPPGSSHRKGLFARLFTGHETAEAAGESGDLAERRVTFEYHDNGMLASVNSLDGKVTYTYENGLVATVTRVPGGADAAVVTPLVRSFEYAANGQLAGENTPDGTHISYDVRQHGERRRVAIGTETARVTAEFDSSNRPLKLTEADGTKTTWRYTDTGAVDAESILPTGESARMTLSADRRKRTLSATDSPVISEEFDDAGRVVKLAVEKSPAAGDDMLAAVADGIVPMEDMLTQQWHPDGTLRSLDFKTHAIIPEYDPLGRVKRVMRVKPNGSDRFSEWQETRLDEAGRVVEVQDFAGGKVAIGYDAQGNVVNVTNTRIKAEGNERKEEQTRYSFQHDAHGRITGVDSPGGRETCEYDTSGDPLAVRVRRGQAEAQVDFSDGRPRRLRQFDGSTVEFDYQTEGPASGQIKQVSTPVIGLNYHYDEQGRLAEVACGDACRVIYGYDSDGNLASLEYAPPVAELHP